MGVDPRLCFVQFLHPGGEAKLKAEEPHEYSWNTSSEHRRRFMRMPGRFVDGPSTQDPKSGTLEFWGEWEAEGTRTAIPRRDRIPFGPAFFCDPWYRPRNGRAGSGGPCSRPTGCQNTDPFVFGDRFLYSNCRQQTKKRANAMQFLQSGSVILFGSCIGKSFCLDTVLVVQSVMPYQLPGHYKDVEKKTSREFMEVTMDHIECDGGRTLYFGVRHDERKMFGDIFSFVPCREYKDGSAGFARPRIDLPEAVSPAQWQGYRWRPERSFDENVRLWNQVVEQVLEQGCLLGIEVGMPQRRA